MTVVVPEHDVAILIPSYRRPEMTARAVESALATGAGEVVVSDDASDDGTAERLASFADPRLRVVIQPKNLGLWKNHLALLRLTSKPWVKFLQNDDLLAPGGLAAMAAAADSEVAVVSALPLYRDAATGNERVPFRLSQPRRWTSDQYMERLRIVGNELETPSNTLYRLDVLDGSDEAWTEDKSCDLICNVLAASRGDVVLLPPGPVVTVDHGERDTYKQGVELWMKRVRNTLEYLSRFPDPRVRRFVEVQSLVQGLASLRIAAGAVRRGRAVYAGFPADFVAIVAKSASSNLPKSMSAALRAVRWRSRQLAGGCLDELVTC